MFDGKFVGLMLLWVGWCGNVLFEDFQNWNFAELDGYSSEWNNSNADEIELWSLENNGSVSIVNTSYSVMLALDNSSTVCFNSSVPSIDDYVIHFDSYVPQNSSIITLYLNQDPIQTIFVSQTIPNASFILRMTDYNFTVCFEINGTRTFIDNLKINQNIPFSRVKEWPQVYKDKAIFELSEDVKHLNTLIVKLVFDDVEKDKYWLRYNMKDIVKVLIDDEEIKQLKYRDNDEGIRLEVTLKDQFHEDSQIYLTIDDGGLQTQDGIQQIVFLYATLSGKKPIIPFYTEDQIQALKSIKQAQSQVISSISYSTSVWGALGATYLISSLLTFCQLIVLYNYVPYPAILTPYRVIINTVLEMFSSVGDATYVFEIIIGKQIPFYDDPEIQEMIEASDDSIDGLLEHGFSSKFFKNSWKDLLGIGIMVIKIIILKLLCFVPLKCLKSSLKQIYKQKWIFLFYQIVLATPMIVIPITNILSSRGLFVFSNPKEKMNLILSIVVLFIFLIAPFFLCFFEIEYERGKLFESHQQAKMNQNEKENRETMQKKKKKKEKLVKMSRYWKKSMINLFDYFLFFFIPFLVGIANIKVFTFLTLFYMIARLGIIIKYRNLYEKCQWIKELLNRLIWLLFNLIYVGYWFIGFMEASSSLRGTLKNMGLLSLILIMIGCLVEAAFVIFQFIGWISKMVRKKICKENQIGDQNLLREKLKLAENNHKKQSNQVLKLQIQSLQQETPRKMKVRKPTKSVIKQNQVIPRQIVAYFQQPKLICAQNKLFNQL